jgi:hypothetical protein
MSVISVRLHKKVPQEYSEYDSREAINSTERDLT